MNIDTVICHWQCLDQFIYQQACKGFTYNTFRCLEDNQPDRPIQIASLLFLINLGEFL